MTDMPSIHRGSLADRLFRQHPASVGESYLQHMRFAGWFSGKLLMAAGVALIHALVPALFEKTAGTILRDLHARMENRH